MTTSTKRVRYFKRQGHSERILAFIVDGIPSGPAANCFPPALLQQVHARDEADKGMEEPLAADARADGDGFEIAYLKLVAGMLGLPLDVIVQRQQARESDERFWWRTAAATFAVVASLAAASALHSWRTIQRANQLIDGSIRSTVELVRTTSRVRDDMRVSAAASIELLKSIESLFNEYKNYDADNPKVRLQRAEMLLDFARNYGKLKRTSEQDRIAKAAFAEIDGLKGTAGSRKRG